MPDTRDGVRLSLVSKHRQGTLRSPRRGTGALAGSGLAGAILRYGRSIWVTFLSLSLAGCFLFGAVERVPTSVGVIERAENLAGRGLWEYDLDTGETVVIDVDDATMLDGSRLGSDPGGTLLFYGAGDDPWYLGLASFAEIPDCYYLRAAGVDDDTHIVFDNGLRLPKADDFDGQGWPQNGRYDLEVAGGDVAAFCINPRGEVTEYRAQ